MRSVKTKSFILAIAIVVFSATALAQSTDRNFPTALTSPEISGAIKARDVGDSRLTSYYFVFDGGQGDIFINAVTSNFAGDIDIFTADTLQPLAKMVSYPEAANSETGRLIYLRKPTRLLLRVEGRSPDDSPATFKIKFGGSFIGLEPSKDDKAPSLAKSEQDESGRRVNSVGTIIAVPAPEQKASLTAKISAASKIEPPVIAKVEEKPAATGKDPAPKPAPVKTTAAPEVKTVFGKKAASKNEKTTLPTRTSASNEAKAEPSRVPAAKKSVAASPKPPIVIVETAKVDPLASIYLVVELKAGDSIRTPMSEVRTFNVVNGILTVVFKNGKTARYAITDVSSFTMR